MPFTVFALRITRFTKTYVERLKCEPRCEPRMGMYIYKSTRLTLQVAVK